MAIQQNLLRGAAPRYISLFLPPFPKSPPEAREAQYETAFLSYSIYDTELARGLRVMLADRGIKLYLDMEESGNEIIDKNGAARIRAKIRECQGLIFLATEHSVVSRWCAWEIGYADGARGAERILVLPTRDLSAQYGNEYLQLYKEYKPTKGGAVFCG